MQLRMLWSDFAVGRPRFAVGGGSTCGACHRSVWSSRRDVTMVMVMVMVMVVVVVVVVVATAVAMGGGDGW